MSKVLLENENIIETRETEMVDNFENYSFEELLALVLKFNNRNDGRNSTSWPRDNSTIELNHFNFRNPELDNGDNLSTEQPTVQDVVEEQTLSDLYDYSSHEVYSQNLKIRILDFLREHHDQNIDCHLAPVPVRDLIEGLSHKYTSSFYLVNLGTVVDKYLLWKQSMPRVEPFYAVKSNPDNLICRTLHALTAGFDCASKAEIAQVLEIGARPNKIIFANPCKQIEHLLYAKEVGVEMMTFDNFSELDKIHKYYKDAKLVLRILPDDSHSLMPFGVKFGASLKDCKGLIEKCKELNMTLMGVSFHVGSGCYSSIAWIEALKICRSIFDMAEEAGFEMTLLDIGGGWPGVESGNLKVSMVGQDISPVIDELFPPEVRVISEPGRFFCAESTTLSTVVVSKRQRIRQSAGEENEEEPENQLYISDGIYGSFNCIIFDHYNPEPKLLAEDSYDRSLQKTTIFGPTCDSMDCITKGYPFPDADIGEWIYFENMGAYTVAAASTFNGMPLPTKEYVMIATPYGQTL